MYLGGVVQVEVYEWTYFESFRMYVEMRQVEIVLFLGSMEDPHLRFPSVLHAKQRATSISRFQDDRRSEFYFKSSRFQDDRQPEFDFMISNISRFQNISS